MVLIVDSHEHDLPESIYQFVERLLKSTETGGRNTVLSVLLGGAHSKWLQNSHSDVDLMLYYTTDAKNLVSFNRTTLAIVPKDRFQQTKSEPVLYEWRGNLYELDTVPARRVGEGNDLFDNLRKCNMHTIHALLKDYPVATDIEPVWSREFDKLREVFMTDEYELSIEAIIGYFRGYMTSQLMSHRRKTDFGKREMKAWKTKDPTPVVKAIMNGMYIGLSGIFLLDERSVSRDFHKLWERYEYLFTDSEREFTEQCYRHKTDKEHITKHVDLFLTDSAKQRDSIFKTLEQQFDTSKGLALRDGRFKVETDQKSNNSILDEFQWRMLGL